MPPFRTGLLAWVAYSGPRGGAAPLAPLPRHRWAGVENRSSQPVEEVIALLAVVRRREGAGRNLLAPDDPACLLRVRPEERVTLGEMPVDGRLASR